MSKLKKKKRLLKKWCMLKNNDNNIKINYVILFNKLYNLKLCNNNKSS